MVKKMEKGKIEEKCGTVTVVKNGEVKTIEDISKSRLREKYIRKGYMVWRWKKVGGEDV